MAKLILSDVCISIILLPMNLSALLISSLLLPFPSPNPSAIPTFFSLLHSICHPSTPCTPVCTWGVWGTGRNAGFSSNSPGLHTQHIYLGLGWIVGTLDRLIIGFSHILLFFKGRFFVYLGRGWVLCMVWIKKLVPWGSSQSFSVVLSNSAHSQIYIPHLSNQKP